MNDAWEKYLAAALQKTFSLDYEFSSLLARYLRTIRAFYEEDLEIRKELLEYWPKHPSMFNTCKHDLQNWTGNRQATFNGRIRQSPDDPLLMIDINGVLTHSAVLIQKTEIWINGKYITLPNGTILPRTPNKIPDRSGNITVGMSYDRHFGWGGAQGECDIRTINPNIKILG